MTEDQTPQISDEDVALAVRAKELKQDGVRQLMQAVRIRKGTEEVRRVNGIAAALAQRWEQQAS